MKRCFLFLSAMSALFVFSSLETLAAGQEKEIVLIVPARPHVLELAFSLADMRNATVVSFRGKAADNTALIHVWNGREWEYVTFDAFCNMSFINRRPDAAVIIGDDQVVPKGIIKNMNWPCKTARLQTLHIADLVNGLNPYFNFSSREWKRLAERYGLKLQDLNAERRAYNPYDVPRSQLPLPAEFKQEKGELPPAVLEKSGGTQATTNQPAQKATEKPDEKPWIK